MTERLPDGWGGDTPRDDTVLRDYAEGWADFVAMVGRASGHPVTRTTDFVAVDAREPFEFSNVAVLLRPVLDADDPVLEEVAACFPPGDEPMPYVVWSATPTPSLTARGWSLMGHPPLMLRPAAPGSTRAPKGLTITPVRDPETLAVFDETLVEAYPVPSMRGRRLFGDALLGEPGLHLWLARVDGEPAGTAVARISDGFVDVEWISTHDRFRGRGVGAALTWTATLVAPDRPAMLFASDLGQPIYERMGYLRLARLTLWVGTRRPG